MFEAKNLNNCFVKLKQLRDILNLPDLSEARNGLVKVTMKEGDKENLACKQKSQLESVEEDSQNTQNVVMKKSNPCQDKTYPNTEKDKNIELKLNCCRQSSDKFSFVCPECHSTFSHKADVNRCGTWPISGASED